MQKGNNTKKRLVISFNNLSPELQEAVRKSYPFGFTEHMMRIDKGGGNFFYAVVFETDEINYLVKIDVNVDGQIDEEEDKEYYNDEIKGAEDIVADSEEDDDGGLDED